MHVTRQQNEFLTRTGTGTPMGNLLRRYWIPALLTEELPEPDGPPARVKLLSERLIAFRDTDGKLGLIDEFCAHRGVSLWFGRNEERGLRCPYHGWKYDVTGQCVEVPSEPVESGYCRKIKLKSYPLVERGRVLWTYLGPAELQPPLPALEWATVPPSHVYPTKRLQECNWLQVLEGGLDSIHSTFLHKYSVGEDPLLKRDEESLALIRGDPHPEFVPAESAGGLHIATRRNAGPNRYYWRVTQFILPCFTQFPPYRDNPHGAHAFVPIDDENCWVYSIDYRPDRPLSTDDIAAMEGGAGIHAALIPGTYRAKANKDNDYLVDRVAQRAKQTFSGVTSVPIQDAAVQESIGPIADRAREHLVSTDNGIIKTRLRLTKAAQDVERGDAPPGLAAEAQRVRAFAAVLPREVSLAEAARRYQESGATAVAPAHA